MCVCVGGGGGGGGRVLQREIIFESMGNSLIVMCVCVGSGRLSGA